MEEGLVTTPMWQGPSGLQLSPNARRPEEVLKLAMQLTEKQQSQIISAFEIEAYEMAAEFAWKKAMVKLKETIATLGMKFVGEMLGRDDFDETTQFESEITDHMAIHIAEQLGVIGPTAAIKLRQSNELIIHYFSRNADEELDFTTAFSIVKSSVQYILGEREISIALEFSRLRERLLAETLSVTDPHVEQIVNAPLFYLRTILTILLASVRNDAGARLENSLANLNLIISGIWGALAESDKWNIGAAYRDVTAAGNPTAIAGIKNALLKVGGFDYVPENLRSLAYIKAAKQVVLTHNSFNNFYNEAPAVAKLSSLGSVIPAHALADCLQAYLAVSIGNRYGVAEKAARIALVELSKISTERWQYYFEKVIQNDEVILGKTEPSQVDRFHDLIKNLPSVKAVKNLPVLNQKYLDAVLNNSPEKVKMAAKKLQEGIRKR